MPLTRNFQLAVKVEDQWATPDTGAVLFAAGNMAFLPINPKVKFNPQITQRDIAQGTLTPAKGVVGQVTGSGTVTHELLSSSSAYTLAPLLRACGLLQIQVVKLKVSSAGIKKNGAAAYLKHGTKLFYGTAAAVPADSYVTCFGDYYDGDPVVFAAYQNDAADLPYNYFLWQAGAAGLTVPVAGNKVTDDDAEGATTETHFVIDTAGVILDGGQGFCPVSHSLHRLSVPVPAGTVTITKGDILVGQTSGSRWQAAHTVVFAAASAGSVACINLTGHLTAGELLHDLTNSDANLGAVEATVDLAEKQLAGCTIGFGVWEDGVRVAISSARGSPVFHFPVGKPATVDFNFEGVKNVIQDAAGTTGITYPDLLPPIFQNTSLVFGKDTGVLSTEEYAPCVESVELTLGNEINPRQCSNAEFGVLEYEITGRKPTGKINPELYQEAVFATLADFVSDVNCRVFFKYARPTPEAHNKFWFWLPSIGMTDVDNGDRNGRATREITFAPNTGTAGFVQHDIDNDFVLIMDNAPSSFA
jgi:hypothetical protein